MSGLFWRLSIVPASILGVVVFVVSARATSAQQPAGIARVAWMQGCWETSSPQRTIDEQWMAPRGGSMIGMSRTVRDGRLVEHELMILSERGDQLAYEAHPSGQKTAVFLSTALTASTVVFENPAHDFPQRIGYERTSADSLTAWVEGPQNGRTRRIEFAYQRAPCPR
jgi:hypothetical protein